MGRTVNLARQLTNHGIFDLLNLAILTRFHGHYFGSVVVNLHIAGHAGVWQLRGSDLIDLE